MCDDVELLCQYGFGHSESAFAELVRRQVDLVYSAALRSVAGDAQHAEDVTQQVFSELARQARRLTGHPALAGWLYTTTQRMARRLMRTEHRRKAREQQAHTMNELLRAPVSEGDWDKLGPVLEQAMHVLGEKDRLALLLRFFQRKTLREVGGVIGLNENAARMRVDRALDKLRAQLARQGVTFTGAALALTLADNAVAAAPPALVATVAAASLEGAAAGTGTTVTLLKIMLMTKLKTGILTAIVVACVATPVLVQHQALVKLRGENQTLRQYAGQLDQVTTENDLLTQRLTNLVARLDHVSAPPHAESNELLRLRAEAGRLRKNLKEMEQARKAELSDPAVTSAKAWAVQVNALKGWLAQNPDKRIPELALLNDQAWFDAVGSTNILQTDADFRQALGRLRRAAKNEFAPMLHQALRDYAQANNGQLPADATLLKPFFSDPIDDSILQRYRMQQSGSLSDSDPNQPLVAEASSPDAEYDTWYGFLLNGTMAGRWPSQPANGQQGPSDR